MIEPGTMLDRYECLHPIGKGGMASVWVARLVGKHGFEKLVAIKTMLPEHAKDPEFLKMLLDEGHILSGIQHPNIASVLDLGEQDGIFYLVFEWVDGEQLSKLRHALKEKKDRMPLGVALRIMADTCAGLHAAHDVCDSQGWPQYIVHRDVSPQNIMLSSRGDVKIIDFGIAKALDRVAGDTLSGKIKGKTLYMAPEHVRSEEIDRRIDIWAAGVILYQLVANRLPIRAQKDFELLRRLAANEEPKALPASVPPEVAAVALKALRPNREERYQTAGEMQRDIEKALVATVGSVTAADVAAFTHQHIGDLIEAKRVAIAEALESAALRSQTGKHKAARDALASLPNLETEAVLARDINLSNSSASSLQEPGPTKSITDLSSSLPYVDALAQANHEPSSASPAWRQWLRTPPGMAAIVGASVALLVLTVSSVYAASSRGDVEPVRPLPFAALKSQVATKATKLAALVPSVPSQPMQPPAQEPPPAASASATAKPSATRQPKVTAPAKTKDPLSVFGTR